MSRALLISISVFLASMVWDRQCQIGLALPLQESTLQFTDSPERTWKSSDGKSRQQGTLVAIEGDKVRLLTPEGKRLTVPLSKLSRDDKAFVDAERGRISPDSPFNSGGSNPFEGEAKTTGNRSPKTKIPMVKVDLGSARPIPIQSQNPIDLTADRWKTQLASSEITPLQIQCRTIHSRVSSCLTSSDQKSLLVFFDDPVGNSPEIAANNISMRDGDIVDGPKIFGLRPDDPAEKNDTSGKTEDGEDTSGKSESGERMPRTDEKTDLLKPVEGGKRGARQTDPNEEMRKKMAEAMQGKNPE